MPGFIGSARAFVAALIVAVAACVGLAAPGHAQDGADEALPEVVQMPLTDQILARFIDAQRKLLTLADEIEQAGDDAARRDPDAMAAKLEEIAKSAGFESFAAFDRVAANITLVIAGIDPDTRTYTDPKITIREDMADVEKDDQLTDTERRELLEDLNDALRVTPDLEYPKNIDVIIANMDDLETVLE